MDPDSLKADEASVVIARALLERGVDPVVAAEGLAAYRTKPQVLLGHDAVAQACGISFKELLQRCCTAYASRAGARAVIRRLLEEFPAHLDAVQGVTRGTGKLPSIRQLMSNARGMAAYRNLAMPAFGDPGWLRFLGEWLRTSGLGVVVARSVASAYRIRLADGAVLEPLFSEAPDAVCAAAGVSLADLRAAELAFVAGRIPDEGAIVASVLAVPGVAEVEKREADEELDLQHFVRDPHEPEMKPPWTFAPEPPSSLRWRMGPGEDYMDRWFAYWRSLTAEQRDAFLKSTPVPTEWQYWVDLLKAEVT